LYSLKEKITKQKEIRFPSLQKGDFQLQSNLEELNKAFEAQSINLKSEEIIPIQLQYLKDLIIKLENQQTAESLKCVIDCIEIPQARSNLSYFL